MSRIEELLLCDEIENSTIYYTSYDQWENAIEIEHSNYFWGFDHISDEDVKLQSKKKEEIKSSESKENNNVNITKENNDQNLQKNLTQAKDVKTLEERLFLPKHHPPAGGGVLKNFVDSKNPAPLLFYSTHKKQ